MSTFILGKGMLANSIQKIEKNANMIGRSICDFREQNDVIKLFDKLRPKKIYLTAATVGGIKANQDYPADFIYDNLMIQTNVINAAYKFDVEKLLFIGSSCIYPRNSKQPIKEEYLLTSELEKTNEFYAIAKIAGLKMIEAYRKQYNVNYISCMPTNLYGEKDNWNLNWNHVIPALIKKFSLAKINNEKSVEIWGDGTQSREFLHVDDCANACVYLMNNYNDSSIINIGSGEVVSIHELCNLICDILKINIYYEYSGHKDNGTQVKTLDTSKLDKLGWKAKIKLRDGLKNIIDAYYKVEKRKQTISKNELQGTS